MKTNFYHSFCPPRFAALLIVMLIGSLGKLNAQVATCNTATNIANLGIDAEVDANNPFSNSDDWFLSGSFSGTGIGIIGTTAATAQPPLKISASAYSSMLQSSGTVAGRNITYVQRMSVPYLTVQNNMLLLDAFAARDNVSSGGADTTVFAGASAKNEDNPTAWTVGSGGVPMKNDIVDVGGHLRRNLNTNDLWGFAFITILANTGGEYSDVEFYRTIPKIVGSNLTNTGPAASGGHTPFLFSNTATIQEPGDVLASVNYSASSGVASIRVWVKPSNVNGLNQDTAWFNAQPNRPFTFTGDFISGAAANGYGYAEIRSKSAAACIIYSTLNSAPAAAGPWGQLSGSSLTYVNNYNTNQFVELAINFTQLGLDLRNMSGACYNIFGSVLFKTRTSNSWSSELKDFAGPFTFGNFAEVQANAGTDRTLNCINPQIALLGNSATPNATFQWTTTNGNIVSGANAAQPIVDKTGTYILTVTSPTLATCVATDTVVVDSSFGLPAAYAGNDIAIDCNTGPTVSVNATASSNTTISWSALAGGNIVSGNATVNPTFNAAAGYVLSVVNNINGCVGKDTVYVSLHMAPPSSAPATVTQPGCNGGCDGSIVTNISSAYEPITYSWSNGATTSSVSGLCAGTYTVTATGSNGCTVSVSHTLTAPSALSGTLTPVAVLCNGDNTGSISFAASGGTTPYSYLWSNGATTQNLQNVTSGNYTVTVTDANNCSWTGSALVTQPAAPLSFTSTKTDILCRNDLSGSIQTQVSGGTSPYTYSWNNGATTSSVTNAGAGAYTVTVTDANSCSSTSNVTLTQPSAILSGSLTPSAVSCNAGNNGSITSSINGGTSPYTYLWNTGQATAGLSGLTAGTYTVTVTDNHGCTIVLNTTITQPAAPLAATAVTTDILCHGNSTGAINLSVSGGTTAYSYLWSNNATTQDISSLPAGFYVVTVTDSKGCTTNYSANLTEPTAPLSATTSKTDILCRNDLSGSITTNVNGGTSPYTYLWSNAATTSGISGVAAGTYTVTITDAHNCKVTVATTLIQPAAILSGSLSTGAVSCNGGSNGSVTSSISGGTTPYQYMWSNGSATASISGVTSGTYTVTVTDAHGCTIIRTANVSQPAAPLNVTSTQTNVLCYGNSTGAINITPTGGTTPYTYLWSNNATTQDLTNITANAYQVTVTDNKGCTFISSAIITQPAGPLTTSISKTAVKCNGGNDGSCTIAASGGTAPYTYVWSNGGNSSSINNVTVGTYTVTVTDANGCSSVKSTTVTQPAAPLTLSETHTNLSCFSQPHGSIDLTATGGTAPYQYNWSNGFTTADLSGLAAAVYSVTVTDANGCTEALSVAITQPAGELHVASTLDHVNCYSGNDGSISLTLTLGTPPYNVMWSTGATSYTISNLTTGLYTASVSDANGCNLEITSFVQQPAAALTSTDSIHPVYCFGDATGSVSLFATDGTAPYTYNWSNGATTSDITGLTSGTYTVTVTDAQGCTETTSHTVTQPSAALNLTASITQPNCVNILDGVIDATITGGTAPYTILWSNGASTEDLSQLGPGNYTILVTDAVNCTVTATYSIDYTASLLTAAATSSAVPCHGDATGSLDLTVNGGTAPYTYVWSNGVTTEDLTNTVTGTYTVTVTDAHGCTTSHTNLISEPAASLAATEQHSDVNCHSDATAAIQLTVTDGTPGYTYLWSDGNTNEDRSNLAQGTYSVVVTDANACTVSVSVTINEPAAPLTAQGSVTDVLCNGNNTGSVILTTSGGTTPYTYVWSNGATTASIQNIPSGQYQVLVTDTNKCTYQTSFTISEPAAAISLSSTLDQVSCTGINNGRITLTVNGGSPAYTFLWNNGATTQDINNLPAGNYSVTITDTHGCTENASMTLQEPLESLDVNGVVSDANCIFGILGNIAINAAGGTTPYAYTWSNGSYAQNLNNVLPGTYFVTVTDINGCTTGKEFTIGDKSVLNVQSDGNATICVGNTVTIHAQTPMPIVAALQWYYNGSPLPGATSTSFVTPAAGTYTLVASTACGSYTSNAIQVEVKSLNSLTVSSDLIVCPGESVQLQASGGEEYVWSPAQGLTDPNSPTPIAHPTVTTEYTVTVKDNFGCTARGTVIVNVMCDTLDIPNGFSPNGDGTNDTFVIDGLSKYPINTLWIYNRWGNLVYKVNNYDNTWDGRSNVKGVVLGEELPNGTYYYLLDLKLDQKPFKGFVVIRR